MSTKPGRLKYAPTWATALILVAIIVIFAGPNLGVVWTVVAAVLAAGAAILVGIYFDRKIKT